MKPSGKKNSKDGKIPKYFKSTQKLHVEDGKISLDNSRAFYIESLKNKLKNMVGNESVPEETDPAVEGAYAIVENKVIGGVQSIENENNHEIEISKNTKCVGCVQKDNDFKGLEEKYKELKKRYMKLTINYTELDLKNKDLLKMATNSTQSSTEHSVASNNDIFSINEIRALQRLPLNKNKDSTFILQALKYAYKNNPSVLRFKSLGGTADSMTISEEGEVEVLPGKEPLSPEKVQRIKELFIERLSTCEIDSVAYGERIKESKINQLLATGIKNIGKRH